MSLPRSPTRSRAPRRDAPAQARLLLGRGGGQPDAAAADAAGGGRAAVDVHPHRRHVRALVWRQPRAAAADARLRLAGPHAGGDGGAGGAVDATPLRRVRRAPRRRGLHDAARPGASAPPLPPSHPPRASSPLPTPSSSRCSCPSPLARACRVADVPGHARAAAAQRRPRRPHLRAGLRRLAAPRRAGASTPPPSGLQVATPRPSRCLCPPTLLLCPPRCSRRCRRSRSPA